MAKSKPAPKPELVYELEGAPPKVFVIRHAPTGTWWGPNGCGYHADLLLAGAYTEQEAKSWAANRPNDDEAMPIAEAIARLGRPNPVVLQAIAALGGR